MPIRKNTNHPVRYLMFSLVRAKAARDPMRMPRGTRTTWWILLFGGLLFTFSDAQIAMDTFGVLPFAQRPLVIMLTYLAAQSLLAVGGVRLILRK